MSWDISALVLRLCLSVSLLFEHGIPKLTGFAGRADSFPSVMTVDGKYVLIFVLVAEVVAPLFLAVGIWTQFAAGLIMMSMLLGFLAGGGEVLALKYACMALPIMLCGSGKFAFRPSY